MDGRFDRRLSSIFIFGTLYGLDGRQTRVRMAVDTGATRTVLRASILRYVGYDLTTNVSPVRMTSATGVQAAVLTWVRNLAALGRSGPLSVVAHELPPTFEGHGLLGRDFFGYNILTIDFTRSIVSLRPPYPRWQFWR